MLFGEHEQDAQKRTTLGLAFLVLGLVLLMWAWGSWMYRTSTAAKPIAVSRSVDAGEESEKAVRIAPAMLVGGILLVVVFLAATFVLVRSSRRYRQSLLKRRGAATTSDDVWAMHRPKEFLDDE